MYIWFFFFFGQFTLCYSTPCAVRVGPIHRAEGTSMTSQHCPPRQVYQLRKFPSRHIHTSPKYTAPKLPTTAPQPDIQTKYQHTCKKKCPVYPPHPSSPPWQPPCPPTPPPLPSPPPTKPSPSSSTPTSPPYPSASSASRRTNPCPNPRPTLYLPHGTMALALCHLSTSTNSPL